MANKMTKKDYFAILRAAYPITAKNYDDVIKFIDHEIELLSKKNSGGAKKLTVQQTENQKAKTAIYEAMEINRLYSISELQKEVEEIEEFSNQRVSALLRQMIESGQIKKTMEKRKAFFSVIKETEEEAEEMETEE